MVICEEYRTRGYWSSPLKNKDVFHKSDGTSKANMLNDKFVSVFTKEGTSSFPDKGPSQYPSMPNKEVNWKGVHKLLKGLKPFKVTGPDPIPAFILKAAADELAPILARLRLILDRFHLIGKTPGLFQFSRRETRTRQRTIALFHILPSLANYWSLPSTAMSWHILTSITC